MTERINAGEFDWQTFGGLHPAPFGHRVYARAIDRLLDTVDLTQQGYYDNEPSVPFWLDVSPRALKVVGSSELVFVV